ncbi:MAG: transcriptional regulator FtsR [Actinomycetes bacterium]
MSIGEVLTHLRAEFPDVTISKIRFLESAGLVEPERSSAGYRKFALADVERLRYVLTVQRDHYLPLRVIKDHLEAIDRGLEPPELGPVNPQVPRALAAAQPASGEDTFTEGQRAVRLSRDELLEACQLTAEQLAALETHGLVRRRSGGWYDGDAVLVGTAVADLAGHGIEPRHLRTFATAAGRQAGLIEQVVAPMLRQHNPDARGRAEERAREIAAVSMRLHAALVKTSLGPLFSQ